MFVKFTAAALAVAMGSATAYAQCNGCTPQWSGDPTNGSVSSSEWQRELEQDREALQRQEWEDQRNQEAQAAAQQQAAANMMAVGLGLMAMGQPHTLSSASPPSRPMQCLSNGYGGAYAGYNCR